MTAPSSSPSGPRLVVYTKPGCFPCRKTIQKFTDAGLTPQIVNVAEHPAALEYVTEELGYSQAPVVVYTADDDSENHWSGLDLARIQRVIDLATTP